jgi:2-keto-3-deoxy-L-arabinonate dehydratase
VIVTISHFSTDIIVDRAKSAPPLGAWMVMIMPPYHRAGLFPAEAGIFEHF